LFKRVEFVSDRMSYIILRGRWFQIIVLNVRALSGTNVGKCVTGSGAVVSAGAVWYYYSHLEVDPITGRRKFIAINKEQILQLAQIELVMVSSLYRV
jgi:hypothetical protein